MASFHNWTGDELIDTQVPQFLNEDNAATQEKLDTKFNKSLDIAEASDLNNFKDEGFYCCNSNYRAETILNCPTNYAFGLMVWGKGEIVYQEVREYNRSSKNQDYNNCWRRSYYSESGQNVWSNWQKMSYAATTLAGYGITDGMGKNVANSVGVPDFLKSNSNTSYLRLAGGDTFNKSATLQLYGGIHTTNAGQFLLNAADSTHSAVLSGSPSGILKWNNKNIVRSINNVAADENGNVAITVDTALSATSTNPVQNRVIKVALDGKLGKNDTAVNASKVNNLTVETAVPKNAKFTDTVYMHPSTHPASMITGLASVATSGNYNDLANKPGDATKSSAGLMSAADKSKLDGISSDGAYIVASLLEQNGYVKFSNGLILQWGLKNSKNSHIVTFPLAFSSAVYSVAIANTVNGEMRYEPYVSNVGKTQFQLSLQGTAYYVYAYWIAVGV